MSELQRTCATITASIPFIFNSLIILVLSGPVFSGEPWQFSEKIKNGEVYENIILAGAVKINPGNDQTKKAREMSGIAWDNDEGMLYGISDDGYIVHMHLKLSADNILNDVEIIKSYPLQDESGKDREEQHADAEGITLDKANNNIKGDTELVLVLDKPARAERYTSTGQFIESIALHHNVNKLAQDPAFEINAIAGNSDTGYRYLTRDRVALKDHLLYIGTDKEHPLPLNNNASINIVGADYIAEDGLYILDRDYKSMWQPVIYCIRHIDNKMQIKNIACFNSQDGWKLDNFETIAHYKDNYFLIMSDDGENFFQKTLLVMFKIIK